MDIVNAIFGAEVSNSAKEAPPPLAPDADVGSDAFRQASTLENFEALGGYMMDLINVACKTPLPANADMELEARLGRFDPLTGSFRPGVTREYMDVALQVFNACNAWANVTPWNYSVDTTYVHGGAQRRTSVAFGSETPTRTTLSSAKSPRIRHMVKERLVAVDHVTDRPGFESDADGAEAYDVRVTLSRETAVDGPTPVVVEPTCTRIKLRKSYFYKPVKAVSPFWRFDFTMAWTGTTSIEADRKQASGDTEFEVEVECMNPQRYLAETNTSASYLISSLMLKVKENLLLAPMRLQEATEAGGGGGGPDLGFAPTRDVHFRIVQYRSYVNDIF